MTNELTQFERMKIVMEYVVPLIHDLQESLGAEVINRALEKRLQKGRDVAMARPRKTADFTRMAQGTEFFAAGGALEYEVIASDDNSFDMNVTHCRYAEMMEQLGGRDFGHLLVCGGDFAAADRLGMKLERSQTRMQGDDFCDFRYRRA